MAPATLAFHGVTGLRIHVDSLHAERYQVALHPMPIDRIERRRIEGQLVHLDRPYYAWTIALNAPVEGAIHFGAWGFTQTLRAEPVLTESQTLPFRGRSA